MASLDRILILIAKIRQYLTDLHALVLMTQQEHEDNLRRARREAGTGRRGPYYGPKGPRSDSVTRLEEFMKHRPIPATPFPEPEEEDLDKDDPTDPA